MFNVVVFISGAVGIALGLRKCAVVLLSRYKVRER